MIHLVDLSIDQPIDVRKGLELLQEESIFYNMLAKLETYTLMPCMKDFVAAFDSPNFASQMKSKAHALKGASGYVGAGRVHYACYAI